MRKALTWRVPRAYLVVLGISGAAVVYAFAGFGTASGFLAVWALALIAAHLGQGCVHQSVHTGYTYVVWATPRTIPGVPSRHVAWGHCTRCHALWLREV